MGGWMVDFWMGLGWVDGVMDGRWVGSGSWMVWGG